MNGTSQGAYDGSAAKSFNITAASVGAAASSHSHSISNVSGLQDALNGKAASSHNHNSSYVSALGTNGNYLTWTKMVLLIILLFLMPQMPIQWMATTKQHSVWAGLLQLNIGLTDGEVVQTRTGRR